MNWAGSAMGPRRESNLKSDGPIAVPRPTMIPRHQRRSVPTHTSPRPKLYPNRGKNWCSEFASYVFRQNGCVTPNPNAGDVHWKNMREFFEQLGSAYSLRAVSAWSNEDKIAKIKPGSFVSIRIGRSSHSLLFTTWIFNDGKPITQYTGISGNNKGMVWAHAPLTLPSPNEFRGMSPEQLAEYDQQAYFGVPPDRK